MFRRGILLIFFWNCILIPLWSSAGWNLYGEISQGFPVFNSEEYEAYRVPTGVGIGFRVDEFFYGLNLGGLFTWNGYPPLANETSFEESWMITGLFSAGWLFPLLKDGDSFIGIGPTAAAGIYTREIIWNDSSMTQSRPLVRFSLDGVLITDNSLSVGTSICINGYLDNQPVWGMSISIQTGYRFGGGK